MSRLIALALTLALLLGLPAPPGPAHAQHIGPVALDQDAVDRWLVAMPAIVALGKASDGPKTDEDARPRVERICAEAGFASYDRCAEVIGYVGMIVGACDRRTRTFRDPVVALRRTIARIEADARLTPEATAKATAELREIVAAFPEGFPPQHIQLMTANRDRVFAVLLANQGPAGAVNPR